MALPRTPDDGVTEFSFRSTFNSNIFLSQELGVTVSSSGNIQNQIAKHININAGAIKLTGLLSMLICDFYISVLLLHF